MNHVVRNVGLIFLAVVFCLSETNVGQSSAQGKKSRIQTTSPPVNQEATSKRHEQPSAVPADPPMRDWLDSSTGLRWTNKDNGKDVSWKEATDYCENLTLGGINNWRLPAIEELVDIQAGTVGQNNPWRFKGNIRAADAVWSSSTSLLNDVWVYVPRAGRRDIDKRRPFNRVICVAEAIAGLIPSYPESTVMPQSVRRYVKDDYTYIDYESNVGPDFVPPIPSETKDKLAIRLRQQENLGSLSEIRVDSSPVYIQMGTDESKVDEVARIVSDDYRFYALNQSEKVWAPLLICYYNRGDGRVTSQAYWFREIPASVVQNRNVIASRLRDHPILRLTARSQCPPHYTSTSSQVPESNANPSSKKNDKTPSPVTRNETPSSPPNEQKSAEKQVSIISPQQEVGTYRAYRVNEAPVDVTVTFENGKLFSSILGQRLPMESIGGRRYKLLVPGRNGYFVTFRPVNGDESKSEVFLEQPPPMSNFVLSKIQ